MFEYRSASTKNIHKAINSIRKGLGTIAKEGSNDPSQKRFKCVPLETMLELMYPLCDDLDVSLVMDSERIDDDIWAYVRITHNQSQEFIASASYLFPKTYLTQNTQQEAGKIMTYQYRNILRILIGIVTVEEDYDHGIKPAAYKPAEKQESSNPACISDAQRKLLYAKANGNKEILGKLCEKLGVSNTTFILKGDMNKAIDEIEALLTNK